LATAIHRLRLGADNIVNKAFTVIRRYVRQTV